MDTLTLSVEQKLLAEERIRLHGLEGRVRVHLMDYRDIPAEWESAFDAFVSVEMLEVCVYSPIQSITPLNNNSTSARSITTPISNLSTGL